MLVDELFCQDKLFVSMETCFARYAAHTVRFVEGSAEHVDHEQRTVAVRAARTGAVETLSFHALVIAAGAATTSPLLGFTRDYAYLKQSWTAFRQALPSATSIVVAGGGPAGVETAGELGEFLNGRVGLFSAASISPKVRITLVSAAPQILPVLRPSIAAKAEAYLAIVGVTVLKSARVTAVAPANAGAEAAASKARVTLSDHSVLHADLYIPATCTRPNTHFIAKELLASDGRLIVNPATLRVHQAGPHVFALGDLASAARPAVHLVLDHVPVLASNLKRQLLLDEGVQDCSAPLEREFKEDLRETQLVPIGKGAGVGAVMGWQLPSFLVWLIKGRGKQWARHLEP